MSPADEANREDPGNRPTGAAEAPVGDVETPPGIWEIRTGGCPVVATAVHAGHDLRPEVEEELALSEAERLREEDPYTDHFTGGACTRVTVHRSRFEVDVNRPREAAVYETPEEAWGLDLWEGDRPPPELVDLSLHEYDVFYAGMGKLLDEVEERFGRFVLLDVHSYNHRREGPGAPPDDPAANPEINVGTGALVDSGDRQHWAPVVERFVAELATVPVLGRPLDVRENVRFRGGHLSRWVAQRYRRVGCPMAIEVKKIYMDEWTGETYRRVMEEILRALEATVPALVEVLDALGAANAVEESVAVEGRP